MFPSFLTLVLFLIFCQAKMLHHESRPNLAVSIPRRPGLDSACVLASRVKIHPSPKADFRAVKIFHSVGRKTGLPQDTHATGCAHRYARPGQRSIPTAKFR